MRPRLIIARICPSADTRARKIGRELGDEGLHTWIEIKTVYAKLS